MALCLPNLDIDRVKEAFCTSVSLYSDRNIHLPYLDMYDCEIISDNLIKVRYLEPRTREGYHEYDGGISYNAASVLKLNMANRNNPEHLCGSAPLTRDMDFKNIQVTVGDHKTSMGILSAALNNTTTIIKHFGTNSRVFELLDKYNSLSKVRASSEFRTLCEDIISKTFPEIPFEYKEIGDGTCLLGQEVISEKEWYGDFYRA
jgi:hypothetical protein